MNRRCAVWAPGFLLLLLGPHGASGASRGPLGGLLGSVGGLFRPPGGLLWRKARIVGSLFLSWAPRGAVLGPFWAILGASWAVGRQSWAVLGLSCAVVAPSLGAS
eukprot:7099780-Pyramimonas_sp.AAC.1